MVIQRAQAFPLGIKFSLKCLLPSYQHILSDSLVVSSFLEPKSSADNFKFDQNSISISTTTTPTKASDYSGVPKITKKSDEEVTIVPCGQWSESVMEIEGCLRSAHKEGGEEELRVPLAVPPRPWMIESSQNGRVAISAEDGTAASRVSIGAIWFGYDEKVIQSDETKFLQFALRVGRVVACAALGREMVAQRWKERCDGKGLLGVTNKLDSGSLRVRENKEGETSS
ncbi:hypothetical protein PIB30_037811 [Stylosanthes scabra]|uniref:Uncharacterized protein n=1 Tax=Stylosanthes scabra TaxID=79078 RepID=A0ABU6QEL5_9FABA|nr:hypothetical protein [Stylosanthes scabra]